jgi:hypothetical protein
MCRHENIMWCRVAKAGGIRSGRAISCEDFIHKTWAHNELRDIFNSVEKIKADARFQTFLRWLYKQQEGAVFRTRRNRERTPQKYH